MNTKWQASRILVMAVFATGLVIGLSGCKIHVDKSEDGKDKKVDIQTPLGGIHVNKDVNVRDTGLPVYPGAREKKKESDHDDGHANVNISSGFFGLKVVVIEFLSDDSPEKVTAYYRDQLKEVRWHSGVPHQEPEQRRAEHQRRSSFRQEGQQADLRSGQRADGRIESWDRG